jgi:hypothetical protein
VDVEFIVKYVGYFVKLIETAVFLNNCLGATIMSS